jgi:hypothetical protein
MEFFFNDPNIERLLPEATRLLDLRADPYPDGRRLRVALELTPFLKRPEIELVLTDPSGDVYASATIIEPMGWKLDLTLHIRALSGAIEGSAVEGMYELTAILTYPDLGEVDRRTVSIEIQPEE